MQKTSTLQSVSSAATSVNSNQLPAIYNKVDWEKVKAATNKETPVILDFGAGKYTSHIRSFCEGNGFKYVAYDPYNGGDISQEELYALGEDEKTVFKPDVIVCSNVLNVIDSDLELLVDHCWIREYNVPYFITVYEGDRSGIGKNTKEDCYQRNQKLDYYILKEDETSKRGVITHKSYKSLIK